MITPLHITENHCQTRDGRPARVLCIDNEGNWPVIAIVEGRPLQYRADGRYVGGETESICDLVERP